MACCRRCPDPAPLIATMAFSGYEFVCLGCGARYGFLDPRAVDPTPELHAKLASLEAEWAEHVAGRLILQGGRYPDCALCDADEPHLQHATPAELAAHREALTWLTQRTVRTAA